MALAIIPIWNSCTVLAKVTTEIWEHGNVAKEVREGEKHEQPDDQTGC